ncbi:MAG: XRE family transcriptional regulator [Ruminococcaceae bacterium]|nr:XRE family transcriptional regulator [Oscillospiraceae bacterium]
MFDYKTLAFNIKKFRKMRGMTQEQLAKKLYMTAQNVSKWELGLSVPDIDKLCQIAQIFELSIDRLLGLHEEEKQSVMLAIDGGGTKTEFVLFTEKAEILSRLVLEGSNPNAYGMEKSCFLLAKGIDSMLEQNINICAIYAGVAGAASGDNRKKMLTFLKNRYRTMKIEVQTDILNVIYSMGKHENCIAAICGTGSIVYAKCGNQLHRLGGWGYLLDQAGSGFDIGRDVIRTALEQKDGIKEKSVLLDLVEQKLGGNVWNKIDVIYSSGTDFIASFAKVAFEAYQQKDKNAKEIIEHNAESLAFLINRAAEQYPCGKQVVLSGGIVCGNPEFQMALLEKIEKEFEVLFANEPQICGAALGCYRMLKKTDSSFLNRFKKHYKKFLEETNAENRDEK